MRPVLDVAAMRAVDARVSVSVGEGRLIERAAFAAATVAVDLLHESGGLYGAEVLVLAGSGHNGADALRVGALLARRGCRVSAVRSSDRPGDEHVQAAWADLVASQGREVTLGDLRGGVQRPVSLVVDGMVGVGSRPGPLTGAAAELAMLAGSLSAPVLAIDVPSGVDASTGAADGAAVRAAVTVTFGALKRGLLVGAGAAHAGQVVVADIGFGPITSAVNVLDASDAAAFLPTPDRSADKYTRGVVGVIAGSDTYPGAGLLVVGGAVRAGAGYVRAPGAPASVIETFPSAVAADGRADVWVGGSGVSESRRAQLRSRWDGSDPFVLDATGLELFGATLIRGRSAWSCITPHAGEFEKLTGVDPATDPIGSALNAAADLSATVVLKGSTTVVATPAGAAWVVLTPTPWLATAGTGDVLSGTIGALVAAAAKREDDLDLAVASAVFLHGLAGRLAAERTAGSAAIAADDLLVTLGEAAASIRSGT